MAMRAGAGAVIGWCAVLQDSSFSRSFLLFLNPLLSTRVTESGNACQMCGNTKQKDNLILWIVDTLKSGWTYKPFTDTNNLNSRNLSTN